MKLIYALLATAALALYSQWRRILAVVGLFYTYDAARILATNVVKLPELQLLHFIGFVLLLTLASKKVSS